MTAADRDKWEERYRAGAYADRAHPTALLERHVLSFARGRALDVACGAGRNALYLAGRGYEVDGIDISAAALERARTEAQAQGLDARFIECDLDRGLPAEIDPTARYELIVMVRYINIPLLRELSARLAPGGALVCEEHLATTSSVAGPSTPAYRVGQGELLAAAGSLAVRYYREGLSLDPDGRRVSLAQLIATRGGSSELDYC